MRTGRWWLPLVALLLLAARPAHAQGWRPTLTMAKAVSFTAVLDKEFPFDPHDQHPTPRGAEGAYAAPVRGRPGLVYSLYAPDAGYVDVRGFKPDEAARCPYTGHIFLVP